jgi:hypothetical protein
MHRTELGDGTTGDGHGEGLACLGPTEYFTDVVPQLLLRNVTHGDMVAELLPEAVEVGRRMFATDRGYDGDMTLP